MRRKWLLSNAWMSGFNGLVGGVTVLTLLKARMLL